MLICYIRVLINDQNTALQHSELKCSGFELIFEGRMSGRASDRLGLKRVLRTLSEGATFLLWKPDRPGHNMGHLVGLVEELRERVINFKSLTDSIDTSSPMGCFLFHVMWPLAEIELEMTAERALVRLAGARGWSQT